jgi:hypothetical protein
MSVWTDMMDRGTGDINKQEDLARKRDQEELIREILRKEARSFEEKYYGSFQSSFKDDLKGDYIIIDYPSRIKDYKDYKDYKF